MGLSKPHLVMVTAAFTSTAAVICERWCTQSCYGLNGNIEYECGACDVGFRCRPGVAEWPQVSAVEVKASSSAQTIYVGEEHRETHNAEVREIRQERDRLGHPVVYNKRLRNVREDVLMEYQNFHFAMLNSNSRHEAYRNALARIVRPGDVVLDIGAGSTAMLSMLSANAAPNVRVVAVEYNANTASIGQKVLTHNNFSAERVKLLQVASTDLDVALMPRAADVLVTETLGTVALQELIHCSTADAYHRGLLRPGGRVIPAAVTQQVVLIESPALLKRMGVGHAAGFDITPFNIMRNTDVTIPTGMLFMRLRDFGYRALAPPVNLFTEALEQPPDDASVGGEARCKSNGEDAHELVHELTVNTTGVAHAAVFYWTAVLDSSPGSGHLSTDPALDDMWNDLAWGQQVQMLEDWDLASAETPPMPLQVTAGEMLRLHTRVTANGATLQMRIKRSHTHGLRRSPFED